tara:strand:+ start:995 stop:1291 length:297 start_codon:yes stop_codon:yes gene_type:complete
MIEIFCTFLNVPVSKVIGSTQLDKGEKADGEGKEKNEQNEEEIDDDDMIGKPFLPNRYPKRWTKMATCVKTFLRSAVHFLGSLPEEQVRINMLGSVVR